MFYPVKAPWFLRQLYPGTVWRMPETGRRLYFTFDDGPHPVITPFVLEQLKRFKAQATFFCIGDNVVRHPLIYKAILEHGHQVGNHTMHHQNGWRTRTREYLSGIEAASGSIVSNLFRPPYGRITPGQLRGIRQHFPQMKVVFWDVLSGDFDPSLTAAECVRNVLAHARPGSIIVFHDSEKAFPRLQEALPALLETLQREGYEFEGLPII